MIRTIIFGALAIVIFAVGAYWRTPAVSLLAVLVFGLYSWGLFNTQFDFAVATLPFSFCRWTIIAAMVAIEFGGYMPEIGRQGRFVNATAAYLIFMLGLHFASELSFRRAAGFLEWSARRERPDPRRMLGLIQPAAFLGAFGAIAFFLAKGLKEGFPIFTHTDRFMFRMQTDDYWFTWVLGNAMVFAALLGVCFAFGRTPRIRIAAAAAMAAFLGSMFLFGEKFFSILMTIGVFIAPALLLNGKKKLSPMTWVLFGAVTLCAASATWYIYSDYGRALPSYTMERILSRASAQGQLWWAAFPETRAFTGDPQQWEQMKGTLFTGGQESAFQEGTGMFYLMRRYMPDEIWAGAQQMQGNVTYTAGTEAYFALVFGLIPGWFAVAALGLLFGVVTAYAAFAFRHPELVRVFLAVKLLGYAVDSSIQVTLWNAIGTRALVTIGAILIYEVTMQLLRKKRLAPTMPRTPLHLLRPQ